MKKILLLPVMLFTVLLSAQDIQITSEGISPVVVQADSLTAQQMYDRAKMYIQKTFKNPVYVIKVNEPGKMLRFESFKHFEAGLATTGNYNYSCELEFKDGRYKISFLDMYFGSGASKAPLDKIYNSKGELRHYDYYEKQHQFYTTMVNEVHQAIKAAILTKGKDNDW